jgi:uncharacterized cupin superfamily protein
MVRNRLILRPGGGQLPPEHLHPRQDERFEVLDGAVRTIIDGVEQRAAAGEGDGANLLENFSDEFRLTGV